MTLIIRLHSAFDNALTRHEKLPSREAQRVSLARADGARNHPPTEEKDASEIENTILARGQHAIDDVAQCLKCYLAEHAKTVLDLAPTPAERDAGALDPYPGYRRVHLRHVLAVEALDKSKLKFRNAPEGFVNARVEALKGNLAAAEARNRKALDHINHAEIEATLAEGSAQAGAAVCQKLIRTWRDANAAIRTTPAPEYFRRLPRFDRELRSVPKVDFNLHREAWRRDLEGLRNCVDATQARLRKISLAVLRIVRLKAANAAMSGLARATEHVRTSGVAVTPLRTAAE